MGHLCCVYLGKFGYCSKGPGQDGGGGKVGVELNTLQPQLRKQGGLQCLLSVRVLHLGLTSSFGQADERGRGTRILWKGGHLRSPNRAPSAFEVFLFSC